jgi:hypothetical protein
MQHRVKEFLLSALVAACAAAGAVAATRTVHLGQSVARTRTVPPRVIAERTAKLDAFARSLHASLERKPPALPHVPHYAPVPIPQAPRVVSSTAQAPPVRAQAPVRVVQPPPVVKYVRPQPTTTPGGSAWSDDGGETEGGDD